MSKKRPQYVVWLWVMVGCIVLTFFLPVFTLGIPLSFFFALMAYRNEYMKKKKEKKT